MIKRGGTHESSGENPVGFVMIGIIDERSIKIGILSNIGIIPFAYSPVFPTYIISNVNIDIAMVTMVFGPIQMKTLSL